MASRCSSGSHSLFLPFLYPSCFTSITTTVPRSIAKTLSNPPRRHSSTHVAQESTSSRLNPAPEDYAAPNFADKASLTLYAGGGGNGCISFLRDMFLPEGPPNGGNGGHGGNIYIQAVHGETSLHKLARKRFIRAERGKNGQGSAKAGQRGEDIIITVPVGTILREISREDPVAEDITYRRALYYERKAWKTRKREREEEAAEAARRELLRAEDGEEVDDHDQSAAKQKETELEDDPEPEDPDREKFLVYPGAARSEIKSLVFPKAPRRERYYHQPPGPLNIDLSRPTPTPILLAAGVWRSRQPTLRLSRVPTPPSTLLRALSNSRTRVGNWAFTTLQPNIGTVVLDSYKGRPVMRSFKRAPSTENGGVLPADEHEQQAEARTRFTIADIPGLIEGAHLDRGLGIAFLRHVERAGVLAFVIDLSAGNAVAALDALWNEVGLYARMREDEERSREADAKINWEIEEEQPARPKYKGRFSDPVMMVADAPAEPERVSGLHIASKPWYVVATKGDKPETQENFKELQAYLEDIKNGVKPHPSGIEEAWTERVTAIPVSAINGHGVDRIVHWTVGLLDD
ncbi:GTP-binding protein [Verticillium alfalfae VaMs.102]|uniref:GTP-binding protein n=1 Tax=Verticillium alfalfae (strain VaMs.102 / ATCC MYA-4576 / FGSC 10136) TaxID=526221 RepID=C9S7M4_VERA1|nr:GTP-binding protein [Verticillium alfalfae VaMs.102]EEY14785.1 GTP-binding protein [Verticillium alfalfae VaMs.102]